MVFRSLEACLKPLFKLNTCIYAILNSASVLKVGMCCPPLSSTNKAGPHCIFTNFKAFLNIWRPLLLEKVKCHELPEYFSESIIEAIWAHYLHGESLAQSPLDILSHTRTLNTSTMHKDPIVNLHVWSIQSFKLIQIDDMLQKCILETIDQINN